MDELYIFMVMKKTFGLIFLLAVSLICCHAAAAQESIASDLQAGCQPVLMPYGTMQYLSGNLYLDGKALTYAEMAEVMPVDLYRQGSGGVRMRNHGKRLIIAGSALTGAGLVLTVSGCVFMMFDGLEIVSVLAFAGGGSGLATGTACLSAGIPLYCVGQSRARRAAASYNMRARADADKLTLNVGTTGNGFGLYLKF